jgi:putative Fe-S oxidoreductase
MSKIKIDKLEMEKIRFGNLLGKYQNGNYEVRIYEDGTKIRENDLDFFNAEFPESMDCKITNKCPFGCPMCHEKSTPDGKHGDIMDAEFIDKLRPGTEMAIGGGAVTGHPDLIPFLEKLKARGVIPNITVHQNEYKEHMGLINELVEKKLIYGLGVSFGSFDDVFWDNVLKNKNVVVHLIAGIHGGDVFDYFFSKGAKILILGYKDFGRGHILKQKAGNLINVQLDWLKNNLKNYMYKFRVISFDNLAIEQLNIKDILSDSLWNSFYQGDDGTHTMYIDLVKKQFAKTSTSIKRYDLLVDVDDMFKIIKEEESLNRKEVDKNG